MKDYTVIHCSFRKSGAAEAMAEYANQSPVLWYTAQNGWEVRIYS